MDGVRLASLRSKRGLAVAGILIVAVIVGIAVGFGMGGGGGQAPLPTTGAYAPISVPKPLVPTLGFQGPLIADPDSMIRQGQDLAELLAAAPGNGHRYTLTISNVSGIGYINSFEWYPPAGVNMVKLIGSTRRTLRDRRTAAASAGTSSRRSPWIPASSAPESI